MKPVFVVEGKTDVQRLQNYIDADFVICNGSALDKETLEYIKRWSLEREVIVLTDPDYPGEQIRKKIAEYVPNIKHAFVDRSLASNGKKLGVAETKKEELLKAIQNYVVFENDYKENITPEMFMELGLTGGEKASKLRELISKKFNLGHGNAKTLRKRLNMLNITFEELKEAIDDCI